MYAQETTQTVLTYTMFTVGVAAPKALVEPPYIDIKCADGSCRRFTAKLQNTFMGRNQIIAVWEPDIFLGFVDSSDTAKLGNKL